jgi:hypothetical protein
VSITTANIAAIGVTSRTSWSPSAARSILLAVILVGFAAGFLATGSTSSAAAVHQAGADLTRLLRAMAAIKMLMVAAAAAAVFWRLSAAITLPWFAAYSVAFAAMAAGPGLIWNMAHLIAGAALLHGGLLAVILLFWRDPIVGNRLAAMVAARRLAS